MSKITMEFARQDDCLDKMVPSDLRLLIGEREALAAHAQAFYDALMRSENISKSSKEMISGIWSCMNTPASCLADVRAEAGRAGFVAGVDYCSDYIDGYYAGIDYDKPADDYANHIRQGGA